ncbi:hypothetical protein MNB_SM-7-120 [hydrothermal vent metagenome]|uniref:Uncharacterized protein n=1 Tax=hydrothermal vent metagenome TaxID=652676 RepID=A0A1W1BBV4_9ZZZZ
MQQFLELFHPLPGNSYLLVTTKLDGVADALYKKIKMVDGSFSIALYGEGEFVDAKIEKIDSLLKPFKASPRDNDRVVFYDIFTKHTSQEMLLKLAYRTLANAAEVVIIEPKGILDTQKTYQLLEKMEFRASNRIDDILDGYDVFVAKKMHMWGNGL